MNPFLSVLGEFGYRQTSDYAKGAKRIDYYAPDHHWKTNIQVVTHLRKGEPYKFEWRGAGTSGGSTESGLRSYLEQDRAKYEGMVARHKAGTGEFSPGSRGNPPRLEAWRGRLRKKQNQLIKLAEAAGYADSTAIDEGGPTIGQMREYVYQEWENTIDRVIADLKSRRGRRNPSPGWFDRCMEGVSRSGSAYDPGAVCGALEKKMGYRRNPAIKPRGFKEESSGTLWYKEYKSLNAAERKLQELLHEGYRAAINFLNGKHRVRVGMDDGPGADYEENPRRRRRRNPWTMSSIKAANKEAGGYFFSRDTMKFFDTKLYSGVYQGTGGVYFVTSEQPPSGPRIFKVRQFDPSSSRIHSHGPWHRSLEDARQMAKELAGPKTQANRRRRKNLSIRKYKKGRLTGYEAATGRAVKFFRKRGSKARKKASRTNPGRYTVLISGTAWVQGHELIISAKSASAARSEAKSWYRRQFPGKRVPGMSVVRTAWIDTAPNKRKNSSTTETLLYNKFRRQGYSVAEAERMAKLNAPYYSRGKKRNRLVHTPTASRRTRKSVEHRISSALRRYASRKPNRTRRRRY